MPVEAELKRKNPAGALISWELNADGTDPVADAGARASLVSILAELQSKLNAGGTVALDAATLAALETITAAVANFPASYPLPAGQVADLKTETGLAKDATLAALLSELTRARKVAEGSAVVAGTAGFVTVVALTPAAKVHVTGFNCDLSSLLDTGYRYRLATGADGAETPLITEQIGSRGNSRIPCDIDIAAGTRIVVQADHDEVTDQTVRASVTYRE